jgi:hypothetical protein
MPAVRKPETRWLSIRIFEPPCGGRSERSFTALPAAKLSDLLLRRCDFIQAEKTQPSALKQSMSVSRVF